MTDADWRNRQAVIASYSEGRTISQRLRLLRRKIVLPLTLTFTREGSWDMIRACKCFWSRSNDMVLLGDRAKWNISSTRGVNRGLERQ